MAQKMMKILKLTMEMLSLTEDSVIRNYYFIITYVVFFKMSSNTLYIGHIAVMTKDVYSSCKELEAKGVHFQKRYLK